MAAPKSQEKQRLGRGYILQFLRYWLPPLLYMALIFFLSSLSKPPIPQPVDWASSDKLYHAIEYAALSFLLARAMVYTLPQIFSGSPWIVALIATILFGASDEWHQSFVPGRFATYSDWIADSFGAALGAFIMYVWYRFSGAKIKD